MKLGMADPPEVTILLLGDANCGKSTFLSYVSSPLFPSTSTPPPHLDLLELPSQNGCLKSYIQKICIFLSLTSTVRRISKGPTTHSAIESLTLLRDGDQPFIFDITFFNRPYRFEFYDTCSPENWTILQPHVIVLCYDISCRLSLINIQRFVSHPTKISLLFILSANQFPYLHALEVLRHSLNHPQWHKAVHTHFPTTHSTPILLLGLKRDLRSETDPNSIIYPQEGYRIAQEMRCDRYLECSAVTGELVYEVFEDICRTAAMSTKGEGKGLSEGGCCVM